MKKVRSISENMLMFICSYNIAAAIFLIVNISLKVNPWITWSIVGIQIFTLYIVLTREVRYKFW